VGFKQQTLSKAGILSTGGDGYDAYTAASLTSLSPSQEEPFEQITNEIIAQNKVERFVGRFESSYRLLACHAALPLVLTPELVNYLRGQPLSPIARMRLIHNFHVARPW